MCRFAGPPKTIGMEKMENNSTPQKSLGSVLWCFTLLPFPESLVCRLCETTMCLNWTENTQSFEIYKWDRNLKPSIIGKKRIWISFIPNQIKKKKKFLTDSYSHSHHEGGGTACIVKGSYCNCHYCKCEKGHVHCGYGKHGHGEFQFLSLFLSAFFSFFLFL